MEKRQLHLQDRYALANGCYTSPTAASRSTSPTDLGSYLVYDADRRFVVASGDRPDQPSADTVWKIRAAGGGPLLLPQRHRDAHGRRRPHLPAHLATGCTPYPESQIDVRGRPRAGITPFQEVRGCVDAHTHGMAFEFLGGDAHCGKPWDPFGAPYALVDCPDHSATGGYGGVLESVLSGQPHHDPVGWPTFKDRPAPDSLTHEGTYYRWLERSWRGGQRIFVNLLVENDQLCKIYPIKHNSCDDMDSIRLQAQDMYDMAGLHRRPVRRSRQGFYRIVYNPWQARKVINAGKLAVIMGIETSVPFGCTFKALPGVTCRPATSTTSRRRSTRSRSSASARWSSSTSSTTRCPASRATRARSASPSTPRTSSRPAPSGTCATATPTSPVRTTTTSSRGRTSVRASRTRCSEPSPSCSARRTCRPCRSTRRRTTATRAASPRSVSTRSASSRRST